MQKTADLQIRLVKAGEMNTHLSEMNFAAAGLAHETKNPLGLILGVAQRLQAAKDVNGAAREAAEQIIDALAQPCLDLRKLRRQFRRQLRLLADRVIDPTTGGLGYGMEYTYSVMERIRLTGLQVNAARVADGSTMNVVVQVTQSAQTGTLAYSGGTITGATVTLEWQCTPGLARKDGSIFPVIITLSRIVRNGRPAGLRGLIMDITERKRAERLLRESEARFAKIFQSSPLPVVISRLADGRYDFDLPPQIDAGWLDLRVGDSVLAGNAAEIRPGRQ